MNGSVPLGKSDLSRSEHGVAWSIDYYAVSGRTTLFHVMLISYLKIFYDVKQKNNDSIKINNIPYVLLQLSKLAQELGKSRQEVSAMLESLERKGYLYTYRAHKRIYFAPVEQIEAPREIPSYQTRNAGERLLPYMFDTSMTVNDLIILEGVVRFILYGTFPLIKGFTFVSYKALAERANCDYRTVKRSIRRLIHRGYLQKFTIIDDNRRRHAYFRAVIPEGSYWIARMQQVRPPRMQQHRPINITYSKINISYLSYHSKINTSYLFKSCDSESPDSGSPPCGYSLPTERGYQKPFRALLKGEIMKERMEQIKRDVKRNHKTNKKTNITGLTATLKAIIPEINRELLPMEKNIIKNVFSVCDKEGVAFREYLEAFCEVRPSLEKQNKFYKKLMDDSVILALGRPEIFDNVFNFIRDPKRKEQLNELKNNGRPKGVIIPTRIFYNRKNIYLTLVYEDNHKEKVSLEEGFKWMGKLRKAVLSNWNVYQAFADYLYTNDIEVDRYLTSMRLFRQADRPQLLRSAIKLIKKELRNK